MLQEEKELYTFSFKDAVFILAAKSSGTECGCTECGTPCEAARGGYPLAGGALPWDSGRPAGYFSRHFPEHLL